MSSLFPQGTFFGINLAETSLQTFSDAENVTADNISNVNTPGATRQEVNITQQDPLVTSPFMSTHVPGTVGQGVIVQSITSANNEAYDDLFRGANSSQNYYSTEQTTLQSLQSFLGAPNSGVATQFANFQTALNQLVSQQGSGSPQASQANVLTAAQAVATALGTSAAAVQTAESQTITQASAAVTTVNGLLDQIAALNGQIRASTAVGDNPNTIADQRNYLIDQLSQYVSVQTAVQADGSTLVTVGGQALVNDTVAYHLANPVIGTTSNGEQTFNVYFATNPPQPSTAASIPLGSGQLAGYQDLYNNKLSVYATQLDQFAQTLSTETNNITESAYDSNGQQGTALFQPIVSTLPIAALNIKCGITSPAQLPVVFANTNAGTLVQPMNSADNTVDPSAQLDGNNNLANPPAAAGIAGTLTVTVNGVQQFFQYQTAPPPAALAAGIPAVPGTPGTPAAVYTSSIDQFITAFNAAGLGVTASFDAASQTIQFARDPNNENATLQTTLGNGNTSASFSLSDSNWSATAPSASLLGVLGANNLQTAANTPVVQDATNAYGQSDNGAANSLVTMFQNNVGFPPVQGTITTGVTAGTPVNFTLPSGVTNVQVGQVLTLSSPIGVAAPPAPENVVVSSVEITGGVETVTFTPSTTFAGPTIVASAQTQTLQQYFGQLMTQVGLDTQTAQTGTTNQTNLTTTIDNQRQSIQGINIDEETQNLIKYQNAYSAAARTISTLNTLLGTIINNLGVTGS